MKKQNYSSKKSIVLSCMTVISLFFSTGCQAKTNKILMIIASSDFRDEEYSVPRAIFEKAGYSVTVACSSLAESTGMLGMKVKPNITLDKANVDEYDAVVFVGGIGAKEYFADPTAHKIATATFAKGKVLAAICIAPNILANAGLLKCKKATCNDSANLIKKGAIYTGKPVERDGKIITGSGPKAAKEFAETIFGSLNSK
jgi:protease I